MIVAFVGVDSGREIGRVELIEDAVDPETGLALEPHLEPDPAVLSIVAGYSGTPHEFMIKYRDWCNGYVRSVKV